MANSDHRHDSYPRYSPPPPPPTTPPATSSPPDYCSEPSSSSSPYVQHSFPHSGNQHLTSTSGVTASGGINSLSPSVNSSTSQSPQTGITPYSSQGSWSMPVTSSYTYGSLTQAGSTTGLMQPNYNRPWGSPTGPGYNARNSQSPATGDGLVPPPYDDVSPPYPIPTPTGGAGHSNVISQPQHHQPSLQGTMLGSQSAGSQPPTPSSTAPPDNYCRAPPTPGYYTLPPSSTPHQASFPSFAPSHHSSLQASSSRTGSMSKPPVLGTHHAPPMQAPPGYGNRSYGYPSLPHAVGTAVLSNMANPGGQMALMGTMNPMAHHYHSGHHHLAPPHAMYHAQPNPHTDRPFKCDQCSQSFNRNHDLKRHKRIHLSIKPFPCEWCDKAFSRKDALKRHRLVKGCGKKQTEAKLDDSPQSTKPDPDASPNSNSGMRTEQYAGARQDSYPVMKLV